MSETDDLTTRARRHAETHPESRELTGAERYLAERLADPEYRAAYEAAAPVTGDDLRERIARASFESQNNTTRWADLGDGSKWIWRHYADAVLAVLPPQPVPVTGDDSEPPEVKRRTRSEVTDDFVEGTRTIREWVNGGGVDGPRLCEELDAWLDYWGGSPVTPTPPPVPPWPDGVLRDAANRLRWIANSGYIEDPGIKRIIRSWADELDATPAPPWPGDDDWCGAVLNDLNSIIHQHCGSDGSDDAHCDWVNDLANEVVRYFQRQDVLAAPHPVPPWPGAVLSGLVDEDGEPTWLAQAGQVRGEAVRLRHRDDEWATWATLDGDEWVEVRAPRAAPEPETERVPWWEARDRLGLAGDPFVEVGSDDEGPWVRVVEGGTKLHSPVDPDGTVEVLRQDGDR